MKRSSIRAVVTADTHIPDFAKSIPSQLLDEAGTVDLILHAGDATSAPVLDRLSERAPVHAVLGNNDGADVSRWGAKESLELEIGGVSCALVHDAGPAKGRARRMRRRFPDADVVFFGHSHIPMDVAEDGIRLVNPGSPTWKRRQPRPTYAIVTFGGGVDVEFRELPVLAR